MNGLSDSVNSRESELQAQRDFLTTIETASRRSVIAICLLLLYLYLTGNAFLSWCGVAVVTISGTVFVKIWRWSHCNQPSSAASSMSDIIKDSLAHVDTEIWLHRYAHLYRYLPLYLSIVVFYAYDLYILSNERNNPIVKGLADAAMLIAFVGPVLIGIGLLWRFFYSAGTRAALMELETRRKSLSDRLACLEGRQSE